MLKAIIFDFNGIILNDEPLHFGAMRDAVAEIGLSVTREEYWTSYLPLDDEHCLSAICRDRGVHLATEASDRILQTKARLYRRLLEDNYPLFPGADPFIHAAARRYPLALASGARREEIERTLDATGLRSQFRVIVASEDFTIGKPHPESFLMALMQLNTILGGASPAILPRECLVIEDAVAGVQGARSAGMSCLAVSNSYSAAELRLANRVVSSLEEVEVDSLDRIIEDSP